MMLFLNAIFYLNNGRMTGDISVVFMTFYQNVLTFDAA